MWKAREPYTARHSQTQKAREPYTARHRKQESHTQPDTARHRKQESQRQVEFTLFRCTSRKASPMAILFFSGSVIPCKPNHTKYTHQVHTPTAHTKRTPSFWVESILEIESVLSPRALKLCRGTDSPVCRGVRGVRWNEFTPPNAQRTARKHSRPADSADSPR